MTFSTDPPLISDLSLIPGTDEKADLNAPAGSGGKLVIAQAPNITITETTVVADAAERLALDVQEGDVAIQTNVSTSFIFTGGDNVANNWETLDFDAVGAIAGEDIAPRDVTASGDIIASGNISLQDLTVAGAINGADTSAAAAGEALTSDGAGGFSFASAGGDLVGLVTATPESIGAFVNSAGAMGVITASQTAMQEVAASQTAMEEVTASQTAMEEVVASPTAMFEIGQSDTAQAEILSSTTAINVLNSNTVTGSRISGPQKTQIADLSVPNVKIYVQSIFAPTGPVSACNNELEVNPNGPNILQNSDINVTIEDFVTSASHGKCTQGSVSNDRETTYEFIPVT